MSMVKITITVGGKPIEMTVEEARSLRDQLNALFDTPVQPSTPLVDWARKFGDCPPVVGTPFSPTVPGYPELPWTVTCGVAQEETK